MGKRWEVVALLVLLLSSAAASAHKTPIVEYTYVGHIWEESYYTMPRQPVTGDRIVLVTTVEHPNETIEGNVTALAAIYQDDTIFEWYGGESYKRPDWLLLKEAWLQPGDRGFTEDVSIDQPGSYHVFIDWYEDNQYIGQSMHMLDVEQRTLGPLWLGFIALVTVGIMLGVRTGVL